MHSRGEDNQCSAPFSSRNYENTSCSGLHSPPVTKQLVCDCPGPLVRHQEPVQSTPSFHYSACVCVWCLKTDTNWQSGNAIMDWTFLRVILTPIPCSFPLLHLLVAPERLQLDPDRCSWQTLLPSQLHHLALSLLTYCSLSLLLLKYLSNCTHPISSPITLSVSQSLKLLTFSLFLSCSSFYLKSCLSASLYLNPHSLSLPPFFITISLSISINLYQFPSLMAELEH